MRKLYENFHILHFQKRIVRKYGIYKNQPSTFNTKNPIFVTWFLVVFGDKVTKILHNSLFTFFTEQGKTGKNGTHGNENLATYFSYFGSFDKKRTYENM